MSEPLYTSNQFQHVSLSTDGTLQIYVIEGDFPWTRVVLENNGKKECALRFNGARLPITSLQNDIIDCIEQAPEGVTMKDLQDALCPAYEPTSVKVKLCDLRRSMRKTFNGTDLLTGRAGKHGAGQTAAAREEESYRSQRLTYRRDLNPCTP